MRFVKLPVTKAGKKLPAIMGSKNQLVFKQYADGLYLDKGKFTHTPNYLTL